MTKKEPISKVIVLEDIRSLHNVGSIFRTADGAGFQKVYLCGYTGCPPDRRIEKVSLGAEEFIQWEKVESAAQLCADLKAQGFEIIAVEQTEKSENIFEASFPSEKVALIFGNEVEGVNEEVLTIADRHVEIPMFGQKSSLNVSVAAGVVLYAVNKLTKKNSKS